MGIFVKGYADSYESSESYVFHIPNEKDFEWIQLNNPTQIDLNAHYPSVDQTYTMLAAGDTSIARLKSNGFPLIFDVRPFNNNGRKIYFTNVKYIQFTSSSSYYNIKYGYDNKSDYSSDVIWSGTRQPYYTASSLKGFGTSQSGKDCSEVNKVFINNNNVIETYYSMYEDDTSLANFFKEFWSDVPAFKPASDPYEQGGSSQTGGGGGSFDNTSTPINIPNLPSISAASTGFISLFNPSLNQLNQLASYMWSDLFQIDGWKKLFADPMDAILGLSIVPVAVPSGGTREVKVGNIGTGISLTVASSQFVEVDCGSIDVNEYWGAYLDYEPYTQAQIFLPYIGTRPISVDEIMGKTVRVVYHVDILTGACCCFVKCGDSVLYTYNGQCSIPIPITGANYTSVVNGVISVAASVGSLVATGGSSAPTEVPSIASSVVNQMKPQVEKSGSISGSAGVLNMQTPYLILIRPRQALPSKQNEFIGYPSLITVQLTELSGYTEVQSIHLENIPATQEELAEIESLLEGGVIF